MSRFSLAELVRLVVEGGADCVQLREKAVGDRELLERAKACRQAAEGCLFIVNDRPDVAVLSGADGVHVGQRDLPPAEARRIIGDGRLLGVSTSQARELAAAEALGADYLGVGCIFETDTKRVEVRGLDFLTRAATLATVPFLAIGGINHDNVAQVIRAGARGVAVSSAVISADDPLEAAREMKKRILAGLSP